MAVHCPECGFVNAEGANYCQKCGAYLAQKDEETGDASTVTYKVNEETGEYLPVDIEDEVEQAGAALVIRSGGGRAGESFTIDEERSASGARPTPRSSSTTSPSRATTRCWSSARTATTSTTSGRSTAPT